MDVLLIDGTNLACIAARHTRAGLSLPACLLAWLKYAMQNTAAKRCICAFDNKGNDRQGIRASILPGYLASRHRRAGARPTIAQHQQKDTHDYVQAAPQRSNLGRHGQSRRLTSYHKLHSTIASAGALPLLADDGYEADDALGCLVEVLQGQHPSLTISIVSSDSDMQQLISDRVTWLEVLDAPTAAQPLGLHHHSLESFVDSYGFHASLYPVYLAMAGGASGCLCQWYTTVPACKHPC
jgi:5'-3' exonuclease